MAILTVPFRHQYGDRSRPTWGNSYDELSLGFKARSDFDNVVQESTTFVACTDSDARLDAKLFIDNFVRRRGGSGLGEVSTLELLAKLGMLLNELATTPE